MGIIYTTLRLLRLIPPTKTIHNDAISRKVQHLYFQEIRLATNIQGFNILPINDNRNSEK